ERSAHGPDGIERVRVDTALGQLAAYTNGALEPGVERVTLAIRPEQIKVASSVDAPASADNRVPARVLESWFLGDSSEHRLDCRGQVLRMTSVPPRLDLAKDVSLELAPNELVVLGESGA
ncbi:MAG TPA: TOBE domain-containing protein, partial [Polyangiaceae bacterium]|nr:TOBE domain-containing protein [Polyangiaceae bacterium]